jgi:hypothetical protein
LIEFKDCCLPISCTAYSSIFPQAYSNPLLPLFLCVSKVCFSYPRENKSKWVSQLLEANNTHSNPLPLLFLCVSKVCFSYPRREQIQMGIAAA